MSRRNFQESEKEILIKLGFKIEIDHKNNEIAVYDNGYEHFLQVEKTFAPPPPLSSAIVINTVILNRQNKIVDKYTYRSHILKNTTIKRIKNLILLLHKTELNKTINDFYKASR